MIKPRMFLAASLLIPALFLAPALRADATPAADTPTVGGIAPRALFDPTGKDAASHFSPANQSENQTSVAPSTAGNGVDVTIQPGAAGYPGVTLKPEGASPWDLSPYGNIQATITNTSAKNIGLVLRVDNDGDWHNSPWSAEDFYFKPGETKIVKVIFGFSFHQHPSFPLKSNAITEVLLFAAGKVSGAPLTFHIDSIEASGSTGEKPAIDPNSVRVVPPNGFLFGPGVTIDAAKQLSGKGGATGSVVDSPTGPSLKLDFPNNTTGEESVTLRPALGKWDLREALEIRIKFRNDSTAPITPRALSTSAGGATETIRADAPLAPGAEGEIVIPFINSKIWQNTPPAVGPNPGTGNRYYNNAVNSVTIAVPTAEAGQTLTVESIKADVPPLTPEPDWLGKRPPVDGEWTKTFDDEFNGTAMDETKWNLCADNYWDSRTHFTKEETTVSDGFATLHYEKKTGYQNDDPTKKQTNYASGYLDTYGKWVQRYGYFEARIKLPKAPGLWPCFWLMPDRGAAGGPQWARSSTGLDTKTNTKGMEFDICEYLSGWGPYRYNIAIHWDGYGKDHKSTGQVSNYAQPDKDGFITPGLLWLPGKAIWYCNGKEILHYENDRVSDAPSNIIFNYVSGGWDNLPLEDAKLPSDFVIDYVRCWQRKDLASDVDGAKTPPPAKTPASTPTATTPPVTK